MTNKQKQLIADIAAKRKRISHLKKYLQREETSLNSTIRHMYDYHTLSPGVYMMDGMLVEINCGYDSFTIRKVEVKI